LTTNEYRMTINLPAGTPGQFLGKTYV
jgi:hypothetical protein